MTPDVFATIQAGLTGVDYRAAGATIAQVSATILSVYVATCLVVLEVARQRYGRSFVGLVRPLRTVWPSVLVAGLSILDGILASFLEVPNAQFWSAISALTMLVVGTAVIAASITVFFRDTVPDEVLNRLVEQLTLADFTTPPKSAGPPDFTTRPNLTTPPDGVDFRILELSATTYNGDKMQELTAVGSVFIRSSDWQALIKVNDVVRNRIGKLAAETNSRQVRCDMGNSVCLMWDQLAREAIAADSAPALRILMLAMHEFLVAWHAAGMPLFDLRNSLVTLSIVEMYALQKGLHGLLDSGIGILETLFKRELAAVAPVAAEHPDWTYAPLGWRGWDDPMNLEEAPVLSDWLTGALIPVSTIGVLALECARIHDEDGMHACLTSLETLAILAYGENLPDHLTRWVFPAIFSGAEQALVAASITPRRRPDLISLPPYRMWPLIKSMSSSHDGSSDVVTSLHDLLQRVDVNSHSSEAIVESAMELARRIVVDNVSTGAELVDGCPASDFSGQPWPWRWELPDGFPIGDFALSPEWWLNALSTILESVVEFLERNMSASADTIHPLALTTHRTCATMLATSKERGWQEATSVLGQIQVRLNGLIYHVS